MQEYTVQFERSARRTRIAIRASEGVVTVLMPETCTQSYAERVLAENQPLVARLLAVDRSLPSAPPPDFRVGALLPMLGAESQVACVPGIARPVYRDGMFQVTTQSPVGVKRQVLQIYRDHAATVVSRKVFSLAHRRNLTYRDITINGAATRWGSCGSDGGLCFSWKLILCPEAAVDYVVAHELAHRIEMNHSAAFWEVVESFCPNYRAWRKLITAEARRLRAWNHLK